MDVDTHQLSLAQQVLERQRGHGRAIAEHLETYARLNAGELGAYRYADDAVGRAWSL
ncbi:hypothetical protein J2X55_001933 [Microbacterium sp. 1154]|uniref:hypothetical protein n=1 Tax=Microbacterium sp. 1154 TaxID=2817733 RepID=UPI000E393CE8|nr:hypothetical protein [Microbacterium sp. 1154]MDR6691021.1 hypothetical protein [Microbacterium sp. 1154]